MITYKSGDLLAAFKNGEIQNIAHGCNCQNSFGPVIAAKIKKEFPEAWAKDCEISKSYTPEEKLGRAFSAKTNFGTVYNVYSQLCYGRKGLRYSNYEAIYNGLEEVKDHLIYRNQTSLGLPYLIFSNNAGADWRIVEKMIEVVFENSGIEVIIYKLSDKSSRV